MQVEVGRGGNTTGVEGSVLDVTRGARGGTETGFEFGFVMVDDESLISPSSGGREGAPEFFDDFVGGSGA